MSKDKLQEAVNRAGRAKAILDDGLLNEAFAMLRDEYSKMLFQTSALDNATREKLYLAYNVVGKVEEHFAHAIAGGAIAKAQIEQDLAVEKRKQKT